MINETEVVALPIRSRYIFKHGFCSHHLLILNKKKRTIGFDFEIFPLFLFKEPEVYFNHLTLVIFFFFFFLLCMFKVLEVKQFIWDHMPFQRWLAFSNLSMIVGQTTNILIFTKVPLHIMHSRISNRYE